jgi:putative membrane protein
MHLGRKYKLTEYLIWTRWEIAYLGSWSFLVTVLLFATHSHSLSMPAPLLAIIGTAVAFVLAFKNQQCYARVTEALAIWGQINSACMILANKLAITVGHPAAAQSSARLTEMFYRHFAWLTSLRFFLRARKPWENTFESGNAKFLAELPTPESQSTLDQELAKYLSNEELHAVIGCRGDREALLLHRQYRVIGDLYGTETIGPSVFLALTNALDDLVRLQGAAKRIKNYPYARNYYSITLILVKAFVGMMPFGLYQYFFDLGKSEGLELWTAWLNIPFSIFVGWAFLTLEKVGENSSNPFEGGPNDVPISFLSRRIEIEMRMMLGENSDLKPIEPKYGILF